MKKNRIVGYSLLLFFFLILLTGSVSAESKTINTEISASSTSGDGYQINNYVVQITFIRESRAIIDLYELKESGDSIKLDFTTFSDQVATYKVGEGTIVVKEVNTTTSKTLVEIIVTDITVEYQKYIDGGVDRAIYIGEPSLELSKEVDKTSANIGDTIRVTIKAINSGSGTAQRISIDPGFTPGFTFKSTIYSTYPTELPVGTSYTQMYIYEVEAAKGGTFTLSPAIATYSSSVFEDDYTAPSTRPTVTVAEEAIETSNLSFTISQDKTELKRNEKITFTINVENLKDVPASMIKITPIIPNNLTYHSGSEDIDMINEKPIIQKSIFGSRYEGEYKFTFKADKVGANILTVKLTYNNGVEDISQEVTSDMFYVERGKYDFMAEYPIYVYITPVIIIIAIAGWLHWRRSQFRM
ncbi:MAG: hypothetical protein KAR85_07815 [Methanosarcinales archaeon]|nr:hypothetical protein [Methanosarcinales archaeon]